MLKNFQLIRIAWIAELVGCEGSGFKSLFKIFFLSPEEKD